MRALVTFLLVFGLFSCNTVSERGEDNITGDPASIPDSMPTLAAAVETASGEPDVSVQTYLLNDITVTVKQRKGDGAEFYCQSIMLVAKDNVIIDTLIFDSEPLGGSYGLSKPRRINNHLVFSKHGNYDGRTIIINTKGEVFDIIGGVNHYVPGQELLFTFYESDIGGFAVFDLNRDVVKIAVQDLDLYPVSLHKALDNRFFLILREEWPDEDEMVVWEIKPETGQVAPVEINTEHLTRRNMLRAWSFGDVNCGF